MVHEIDEFTGEPIVHDIPDLDDPGRPKTIKPPTFDQSDPVAFNVIVETVRNMTGVSATVARDFVERWGTSLGTADPKGLVAFPAAATLFNNADFVNGVQWLPLWSQFPTGAPPVFNLDMGDGTFQAFTADFLKGGQRVGGVNPAEAAARGVPTGFVPGLPVVSLGDLIGAPPTPPGGGGRGRADRAFDKNELREAGNNMWRSLLLKVDSDQVASAVDDYVRQANGFWKSEGGNLDFQTFMLERIRGTERHTSLYADKPSHMSEAQFMADATNVVNSFPSLRQSDRTGEIETTLTSGGSLAGQAQRIGSTERVFRANPQTFTTKLANTVSRLGRGALR